MNSPFVADGKVFVGGAILAASKELNVLATNPPPIIHSTPCAANGVLFMVLNKRLWAIFDKGDRP